MEDGPKDEEGWGAKGEEAEAEEEGEEEEGAIAVVILEMGTRAPVPGVSGVRDGAVIEGLGRG